MDNCFSSSSGVNVIAGHVPGNQYSQTQDSIVHHRLSAVLVTSVPLDNSVVGGSLD